MAHIRKVIRVFLASPGDLDNERQLARSLVDQHNEAYAEALGYHVELVGWEDTVSVFGRPQETINKDLETCELFIGMLWKKWGTPPDTEGKFSSGFEEEFSISIDRRKNEGTPEISLLFKDVDQEFLKDPGSDLKKVLKFRDDLINNKNVLFTNFSNDTDFSNKFRKCLANYISTLKKHEYDISNKDENKISSSNVQTNEADSGFISKDAKSCIIDLINKASNKNIDNEISSFDIARFRLMACALYRSGNDKTYLGVHDNNLLYLQENRFKATLSKNEYISLVQSGLFYYNDENTPLWHWIEKGKIDLIYLTMHYDSSISEASFKALAQLNHQVGEKFREQNIIGEWLTNESETRVKSALEYLSCCGEKIDINIINSTPKLLEKYSSEAQKAIIMILSRFSKDETLLQLTKFQYNNIDDRFVSIIYSDADNISSKTLIQSLEHKNSNIRKNSIDILIKRKAFNNEIASQLANDNDFDIKLTCLIYLYENDIKFSTEEIKSKLIIKNPTFNNYGYDKDHYYNEYQRIILKFNSIEELLDNEQKEDIYSINNFIALTQRGHAPSLAKLRRYIDNEFVDFYKEKLNALELLLNGYSSNTIIDDLKKLEKYLRSKHVKQSIDFLCSKKDKVDLLRVRKHIIKSTKECDVNEIDYLSRFGEWNDVQLILDIVKNSSSGYSLLSSLTPKLNTQQHAANAIYNIGNSRLIDLLSMEMTGEIKSRIISKIPIKKFKSLDNQFIFNELLNSEHVAVRKISSLKCSQSLSKDRIDSLILDCLNANTFYYNVIHWLDFGRNRRKDEINHSISNYINSLF